MATIDQQFVEYIVKTLVNNPDKVIVDRQIDEKGVLLSLTVDPEDVGRVIGRRGATAQSIRTLPRAEKPEKADKPAEATEGPEAVEGPEAPAEEEPAEVDESAVAEDTFGDEDEASDLAEKTRAELADMDDLDI